MKERYILHSDANCFYASVEMLLNPSLRGKAVAVCGSTEERHGIVLAKSELAKKAGVKTGQANWEARQACPGLIVVPPQYDQYCKFSKLLRNIYLRYTDLVEPYGMDECWLDVSDSCRLYGSGEQIAQEIRRTVKDELGITVSIGVSFNKIFAKLGSDMKKPDAVTVLGRENWRERIWPLPVSELLFVGRATTKKLLSRNVFTIGDLAKVPPEYLMSWFGKNGIMLWRFANGEDTSRIMQNEYKPPVNSVGHGITCSCDLHSNEDVWKVMLELTQDIGHRLRQYGLSAKGVRLAVRSNDLSGNQYQTQLRYPSQSPMEIAQAARILFLERYNWNTPVRAVSVTGINLVPSDQPSQLDLFGDETRRMRRQKLEDCIDEIRGRFGNHSIYAACVRVIAETIASLPIHVYEQTDGGSKKAVDHPLYKILHDEPNTEMTSFVWREVMLSHLLLWGNCYCQIIRSGRNKILGLYPLLPDHMEVDRDSKGQLTYTYTTNEGQAVSLRPEDVLHIPGLGFDGVMGYSPIALEKNAIGLGIAAEEYGSKFFSNGATPSGVLTHPNTVKDPQRLRESWTKAYGGSSNSGKVAILEEGMKFDRISMPNNEAQFLETRKFQVSEICRIYRVPPHLVGDLEHATFSNIEHQSISFATHTIRPWLVRIEQAINRALFSPKEKERFFVQFNIDGLLRGDYKSRMEGYAIARQNGWLSANDIRELENLNPITDEDGGNLYLVNGNMIPINAAAAVVAAAGGENLENHQP